MDSKKSNNDARIKVLEEIEKLCHSKDISAKEIAQILYESFSIKSDFFPNDVPNVFSTLSNSDCKYNDEELKRIIYNQAKNMHLSLLQSINNAQPITDDRDKDSDVESLSLQSTGDQSTSENLSGKNCIVSDKDSEFLHAATESVHDFNNNSDATDSNIKGNTVDTATRASTDKTDAIEEITNEKESTQKKLSIVELEKELINRTPFIVINDLVYHYDENAHYYKLVDQDDVIGLYRYYIDPTLNDAPNLRCFNDLYRCIKTDPSLKRTIDFEQETYCPLQDGIYFFHNGQICREDHSPKHITFTCLKASRIPPKKTAEERRATCPSFIKFIEDTSGNDEDVRNRILMALGYLLVDTKRGKFFFLAGFKQIGRAHV